MKRIEIIIDSGNLINFIDDDNSNIEEFTKKLLNTFASNNVISFISTRNESVIIRPSQIRAIRITNISYDSENKNDKELVISDENIDSPNNDLKENENKE